VRSTSLNAESSSIKGMAFMALLDETG